MAKSPKAFFPEYKYNKVVTDLIVTAPLAAASVDNWAFIADEAYQVISIKEIHSVVGGASAAVRPRKVSDTSAPGAAASTTVVELSAAADLTATINTTQTLTLTSTLSSVQLAAGDKIGLDFSGTLTGLVGTLVIALRRI